MKKAIRPIIFLAFLLLMFSLCTALAENSQPVSGEQVVVWTLHPWTYDGKNLAVLSTSPYCRNSEPDWYVLPNGDLADGEVQSRLWFAWTSEDLCDFPDNTIPEESGFDAPEAQKTLPIVSYVLDKLGLNEEHWAAEPVYFATYGRLKGFEKTRKVLLEETLDGLPVRWSEPSLYSYLTGFSMARKNCVEMYFSDEDGLIYIQGNWSVFEPQKTSGTLLSETEINAIFAEAGFKNPAPEKCWFLHVNGQAATATLAWRVQNSFVNAADGSWLQTSD
ncbi:MAG: hypothetical protein IJK71_09495 [Clostridia bacterium]|nr:hypothetical protein [Clostridia bacterium]